MYDQRNSSNGLVRRNYQVSIGLFLGEGWQIISQNVGGFIGFFVISLIISIVLSNIPGGALVNGFVSAILVAGNYIVGFKLLRGQPTSFGDFFTGFQGNRFLPILLTSLLTGLFSGIFSILAALSLMVGFLPSFRSILEQIQLEEATSDPELDQIVDFVQRLPEIPAAVTLLLIILGIILLVPAIYLGVAYTFAVPLVVERRIEFWAAMEASRKTVTHQWFGIFGLLFVLGLVNFAGACLCGLGLLVTVPLSYGVIVAAYNNIFGLSDQPI